MLSLQRQIAVKGGLVLDTSILNDKNTFCMKMFSNEGKEKGIIVFQKATQSLNSTSDKVLEKSEYVTHRQISNSQASSCFLSHEKSRDYRSTQSKTGKIQQFSTTDLASWLEQW